MLQSTPSPMTQMSPPTGESDPSIRGLLMTTLEKNRDLKPSLEISMMSLPVLLRALQPMLQSTPSPMTQMLLTTGESDPSRGLLKVQGSRISCSRDRQPHESGPTMGQLRTQSSRRSCSRDYRQLLPSPEHPVGAWRIRRRSHPESAVVGR